MGITNQNKSSDCFTFQAGLKGIRRCSWWRSDVVSLLLLMVSVFPGCFSFMRRAVQVYVLKQYIHVTLRSPYPWCGLGRGTSPCIGPMKVGWMKYLTMETISLSTGCSFPPWSSESWSIPFNVGSSVSPCCFSSGFPPCWAMGCRDSHMTALMLRKYQECDTQCKQISAFLAALLPGYESLGPLLSLCFQWNSSIPLQLGG